MQHYPGRRPSSSGSRRSRLALPAAAALTVAVPLLTGCGSDARPGAAAVVGGERITVSQVQAQAEQVRQAQRAADGGDQLISGTGWLNRAALDTLIRYRVIERTAEEAGVSVSRREVQKERAELESSAGGKERLEQMLLQQRPLAPEQIDEDLRMQLLVEKVATALGADLSDPRGQAVVRQRLTEVSMDMDVDVSPRYGKWDDERIGLGEIKEPWLRETPEEKGTKLA